jgi:hypothetical protein
VTIYKWYYIFNADEFSDTGLVQRTYTLILENLGQKDILVTKGNYTGMTYEGVFLPLRMHDQNPFAIDGFAIWIDDETRNVFLGIEEPAEDDEN